jgi:hypothetical protein
MNKEFIKAFILGEAINYVKFYDFTSGDTIERGSINDALSEFMLSDLATEAQNRLIEVKEFTVLGDEK